MLILSTTVCIFTKWKRCIFLDILPKIRGKLRLKIFWTVYNFFYKRLWCKIHFFTFSKSNTTKSRSSSSEVFLEKGVLKICCKFTGEHLCWSVISIKLQSNFIEITLRHGWSPVNLQHIFKILFLKNTSGRLLLKIKTLHFTIYMAGAEAY